jgi:hypothetical protein
MLIFLAALSVAVVHGTAAAPTVPQQIWMNNDRRFREESGSAQIDAEVDGYLLVLTTKRVATECSSASIPR